MSLRCFIAVELPETVKIALNNLQEELKKTEADVKWVRPDGMHLTLKFLGYVEEENIKEIVNTMDRICREYPPFNLEVRGAGMFPNIRAPRVLWVSVEGNNILAGLQAAIEKEMASLGFEKEDRPFTAHLTLGRVKSFRGRERLIEVMQLHKEDIFGFMEVKSISLMKSDLRPTGAQYTRLAELTLGQGGGNV
ncbi:MAG: RNA 2',3'-cyclic phosphodiesterase [Nitrospirae bacterium]|nr:RNA 2',3'-cyclic phosphodiesterase [Nitrospirota bacterium]